MVAAVVVAVVVVVVAAVLVAAANPAPGRSSAILLHPLLRVILL